MEAFFTSTAAVALAELGDKTQLLALFLAASFTNSKFKICLGILIATLLNHAVSAWFGDWLGVWIGGSLHSGLASLLVPLSFVVVGLWLLIPDSDPSNTAKVNRFGAFSTTLVLFFLAELGDKTQVATVLLAAEYQSVVMVTLGTTLGMLLANVPVVFLGSRLMQHINLDLTRKLAALSFIVIGVWWLIQNLI